MMFGILKNEDGQKTASQIGCKALTVREMFTGTKDGVNKSSSFKSLLGVMKSFLEQDKLILKEMPLLAISEG